MSKKLIPIMDVMQAGNLSDEFMAIASTIEQSLIESGAVPDQDYSYVDLYNLAQPFVLEIAKTGDLNIGYVYPTKELIN
jgi:hypothetical protein